MDSLWNNDDFGLIWLEVFSSSVDSPISGSLFGEHETRPVVPGPKGDMVSPGHTFNLFFREGELHLIRVTGMTNYSHLKWVRSRTMGTRHWLDVLTWVTRRSLYICFCRSVRELLRWSFETPLSEYWLTEVRWNLVFPLSSVKTPVFSVVQWEIRKREKDICSDRTWHHWKTEPTR